MALNFQLIRNRWPGPPFLKYLELENPVSVGSSTAWPTMYRGFHVTHNVLSIILYPFTGGEMTDVGPSFILHACSLLKCMYTTKNKMTARNNICFPWD